METKTVLSSGIYLVIDPSMDEKTLLSKLAIIVQERIVAVQVWDNFREGQAVESLLTKISLLCSKANIPLLINNQWSYLESVPLDGVHFDEIPSDLAAIRKTIQRPFIQGLTCNNDLSQVQWAAENGMDYISFCSIFPSATSTSCELVDFQTIRDAKRLFNKPIFLAGGINPQNVGELSELRCNGIAVISGIMGSENPQTAIQTYYKHLGEYDENRNY
ncbi:thiamine phosphate synthase [Sphingobacterium hungaricum]|uniref:Thiamine phosphate synthase n=1 Tax=Sphingobacterium hungaricum TaxID=2082723 RepID=A0A928UZS3_9SPHI|nr:thiamine phosphate synthase [Sphingobacterium hungaricum]MBE8714440.1 thiamine phosphate synthase [Sphingobacterium hungaricum]